MKKRLWAVFLTICLVAALLPTTALAADPALQGYCGADASYERQTYNYSTEWNNATQTFTGTYYSNAVWTITENGTMPSSTKPAYKLTISGTGAIGDFGPSWSFGRPWHFELIKNNIAVTDVRLSITAIEISDGITEIGAHAFEAYPNVTSIVIPDSVTKIGEKAFNYCQGATSITLGSGLREIGKTAFSDCDALTTISFPDKLETIGESAFSGCNNLSGDLVIPDSVKTIGEAAFANDTKLTGTLTIGNSVASIGNSAFSGCKFTGALSIPDSVTSIGDSAFTNCKFTELSLGNGLTEIGESALNTSGTYSGHLLIPDSVTTIGKTAFSGVGFSSISLGKAVSTIGRSAFANCTSIHSLDITAVSSSVTYGDSAFHSLRKPNTIYVNSDPQKSAVSAAITDGRTAFAITNGGTFPVTTQFSADQLATPVKDGCIFGGWYTDETCTQEFTGTPAANSTYYAKWSEIIAEVDGVNYDTLAAAINAASSGDTVTLLKDVTENVTIPADKTITLDLNGKVLSGGTVASTPALLNNGTVTIKDSSAEGTGMIRREDNNAAGYYVIDNQGTMTIENGSVYNATGTMPDGSSLIRNAGKSNEARLTINGGHIKQDGFIAIKNDDHGVLEINGGLIETSGDTATNTASAVQNWAKATINNGTFNGTIWVGVWNNALPSSVTTIKNAEVNGKIVVKPDSSGLMVAPKLNIEGGNFDVTGWDVSNSDNIDISGGSFSTDLKNTGYLADSVGAEVKSADGSTYGYYANVAAATAAAKPGDTVTDLKATTESKVTLTMKYNDGATADITYNVASGTTITLPAPTRIGYTFNGWYDGSTKVSNPYTVSATATLNASWSYISSGSSSYDPTYSVSTPSKTENGSVTVSPKSASKGDTVTVTVKPDSGYVLETLTVTDKNGNELTLKDKGNGKYTFTMPAGKVEVKATFMDDNTMLNFFVDVKSGDYYYDAVLWAAKNGITSGTDAVHFSPEQPCTRAQIVTFLWRAAGSPEPKGTAAGMTDVVSGSYYEKAVAWAIENGVTTGTTATTFSPDATCTRAQSVTFLFRAIGKLVDSKAEFSDVLTDSYYANAVAWAVENGVTNGIGDGLFGPDNSCTRAQIVTFLFRAYQGK